MKSSYLQIFYNILATILIIKTVEASLDDLNYRLTDVINPSHYDIELKTYLLENFDQPEKRFTFDGTTKITLSTKSKYVDKIILHAKNLKISKIHLKLNVQNAQEIGTYISNYNNVTEKLSISLKKNLEPGQNYTLELKYSGEMKYPGIYLTSYQNGENEKVYIAASRFSPNYARLVFPCFDEPKFKTTFQLRINRENGYHSTSNTKLSHIIPVPEQRSIDVFKVTPLMSTFGLAFMISDFRSRKPAYGEISVLAPPNDYIKTAFATDAAPQILQKLNEYTDIPYTSTVNIEKLNLIALPAYEYESGLSHFGFICFKKANIINNLKEKNFENMGNTIEYLSHEMAHLWFGNLVTPEWWNYNWLSDGLAVYIGYIAANEAFPEYDFDQRFMSKVSMVGLSNDCHRSPPLVNKTAENTSNLNSFFEGLVNRKGPAIFQMIAHMMGHKWFKISIQKYLRKNLYKTVTNEDLLQILRDDWRDNDLNVRTFLADWTEQPGYPVVTVQLSEDGKSMKLRQKRFLIDPKSDDDKYLQYTIPFTYTTNIENDFENTKTNKYLRKNMVEQINLNHKADWVIANIQFVGYYRVNYDEKNWLNIFSALKSDNFGGIHVKNRAQIVDDLLQFGKSGLLDYKFVFEILEYLEKEEENLPWQEIDNKFNEISSRLTAEEKSWFRNYELSIVSHIYEKLSFHDQEDDKPLDIYNRNKIRAIACRAGHSNCILNAKDVFDDQIYNNKPIPTNMRKVVFCTAVREYGQIYVDYLWNLYTSTPDEELEEYDLEVDIVSGLACTNKKEDIYKLLDFLWDGNKKTWNAHLIVNNNENPDDIIQYFLDHKDSVKDRNIFPYLFWTVGNYGTTDKHLNIFKEVQIENEDYMDGDEYNDFINFYKKRMESEKMKFPNLLQYLEDTHSGTVILSLNNIFISILLITQTWLLF